MSVLHRGCVVQPGTPLHLKRLRKSKSLAGTRKVTSLARPANFGACTKLQPKSKRAQPVQVRASSERGGSFTTGFILGGVIFGSLGFLFAPQISRALLTEDQKLKLPRFLEDEVRDPEQTKQELSDKIAQLNAAIDEVSNQMKAKDPKPEVEEVVA